MAKAEVAPPAMTAAVVSAIPHFRVVIMGELPSICGHYCVANAHLGSVATCISWIQKTPRPFAPLLTGPSKHENSKQNDPGGMKKSKTGHFGGPAGRRPAIAEQSRFMSGPSLRGPSGPLPILAFMS